MLISRRTFIKRMSAMGGVVWAGAGACARESHGVPAAFTPAYAKLEEEGQLVERIEEARAHLAHCMLCPRHCGVNRTRGETGFCRAPANPVVFSHQPHYGEETPLVGRRGSGTIFFSHCNLRCVFCQNWPIAHEGRGQVETEARLAERMLDLQRRGCHNINLVTPTHMLPFILGAVRMAYRQGLHLPLCYNTGGYEDPGVVRLLDGIVDIYLPDLKFMDSEHAARYAVAGAGDYPQHAKASIREMHRQVGVLQTDASGTALRGLMIRHLVMPNRVAGTQAFVQWVAEHLPKDTYVNLMAQYRVEHEAFKHPLIARAITGAEFVEAIRWAREAGLTRLDRRSADQYELFLGR